MTAAAFERMARAVRLLLPLEDVEASPCPASPFDAVRWNGSPVPEVHVGGHWSALVSVNGVPAGELVRASAELGRRDWQRMMMVEFGAVAAAAGAGGRDYLVATAGSPGITVAPTAQALVTSVWYYLAGDGFAGAPDATAALADLGHLADRPDVLAGEQVLLDLRVLERLVAHEFAYWDVASREWEGRLGQLYREAGRTSRLDHVEKLRDLMVMLGDGHTRVNAFDRDLACKGVLPFQFDWIDQTLVAVQEDRTALLDAEHPVVEAIAGRPIEHWLRAARHAVPRGTSAMRRNWLAREVRRVGALAPAVSASVRQDGGKLKVDVTLAAERGTSRIERDVELRCVDGKAARPAVESQWVAGKTGYLALRGSMTSDPAAIAEAHRAMRSFAGADALVIDIRDNGGGSRDLLRAVIGYLLEPGEAVVTSWARLRREPELDPDGIEHVLEGRYMHPWNWTGWSAPARRAAERFAQTHIPEWPPIEDERFGPLNLLIAERLEQHEDVHLSCPVAVLVNMRNYSASDIFASSLAAVSGVLLFGTPTAGGSGFARTTVLPGSGLTIQISTMASGMVSGDLYENRGVVPDEIIEPSLAQWREGLPGDPVLLRALHRLSEAGVRRSRPTFSVSR